MEAKKDLIDASHATLSIERQCKLIGLPRSSYYRVTQVCKESPTNLKLLRLIDEVYTRSPFYGSRKIRAHLQREGLEVNRKRVQRLMRVLGISSVTPKPNTSKKHKENPVYPYLLKGLNINNVHQVWSTDITYIRLSGGFVYLVAIIDWYSRKVLSWELSNTMDTEFCVTALERAIRLYGKPDIFNTDQGAQFTSEYFTSVLKRQDIKISMDGKGRWADNIFVERLWRTVKYEYVYLHEHKTAAELKKGLKSYFHFYNQVRLHQALNYATPQEVHAHKLKKAA